MHIILSITHNLLDPNIFIKNKKVQNLIDYYNISVQ